MIPRGSIKLMYAMVLKDRREMIYRSLCALADSPRTVLHLTEAIADRTEGKPTQRIEASVARTTVFGPDVPVAESLPIGEGESGLPPESGAPLVGDAVRRVVDEAIATRAVTTSLLGLDVEPT